MNVSVIEPTILL